MIKLKIDAHTDREKLVSILAHNGYKVWIEPSGEGLIRLGLKAVYVCFEGEKVIIEEAQNNGN